MSAASCRAQTTAPAQPGSGYQIALSPQSAFTFLLLKGGSEFAQISSIAWGPSWQWVEAADKQGYAAADTLDETSPIVIKQDGSQTVNEREQVTKSGASTVKFQYSLTTPNDVPLTMIGDSVSMSSAFNNGSIDYTTADGHSGTIQIPIVRSALPPAITSLIFHVKDAGDVVAKFDPAIGIALENGSVRIQLAADKLPAGSHSQTMSLTFPGPVELLDTQQQAGALTKVMAGDGWYAWQPTNNPAQGEIGMEGWLDGPAGKHGAVKVNGAHLELADGTPIKFWGTNLAYNSVDPPKADADATAERFAKFGVNCVRLHKFLNPGWEGFGSPDVSNQFDSAGLDRFDYFTSALKKRGVYFGWSHSYHYKIRPGDRSQLLNYDEIMNNLGGDTYGLIYGAPDVQDVYIKMVVALLQHKNAYTGLTYAHEPSLAFIETTNEDSMFFYTFSGAIDKCPTYKEALRKQFAAWLKQKYVTQDALSQAWGTELHNGETVDTAVDIQSNPWFFSDDNLGKQTDKFVRRRLIDNALFYFDEEESFYGKFATAVRAAGYVGPLIGSPWWAPTTLPQYLNLEADAHDGLVDRHNYFQGSDQIFSSMLADPGSGYLNTGLLHVAGHPFSLSEWSHVWPDVYRAEGPVLMAAYAFGLQGWDGSYEFQSQPTGAFEKDSGHPAFDIWNTDVPSQMGQFPTLTRMIYRGDVKEGDVIATKRVSNEQLESGHFDFSDTAQVNGDIKSFTGSVPQEAIAAGRTLVQFTDKTLPSTFPDLTKYETGKVIQSTTQQLAWDYSGKGFITINTPGTVGVTGFAENKPLSLGSFSIDSLSPFEAVTITSLEKEHTLANCRKALVTAVGRECNTGFSYFSVDDSVLANGQAPIMEEGVSSTISLSARTIKQVNVLDQDGQLQPGATVPVTAGHTFKIDTARDKTIYYEIIFS
jgi:hypothetical protein